MPAEESGLEGRPLEWGNYVLDGGPNLLWHPPAPFEVSDPQSRLRFVVRESLDDQCLIRKVRILQQLWVTTRYEVINYQITPRVVGSEWRDVPLEVE